MIFEQGTKFTFRSREQCREFARLLPERAFTTERDGVSVLLTCSTEVTIVGGPNDRLVQLTPRPNESANDNQIIGGGLQ